MGCYRHHCHRSVYAADRVAVLPCTNEKIVLKEYLTENNASYYATAEVDGSTLKIELCTRSSCSGKVTAHIAASINFKINAGSTTGKADNNFSNTFDTSDL